MCQASKLLPRLCRIIPCRRALVVVVFFAFGIAMPIMMQHRFIRGGDWAAGRALRGALAGVQTRPWPAKTPPGSCSVALSDRSQCDSTGPAAVWADDQAVTRALQARKSPRQICAKGFGRSLLTATSSKTLRQWPEPAQVSTKG